MSEQKKFSEALAAMGEIAAGVGELKGQRDSARERVAELEKQLHEACQDRNELQRLLSEGFAVGFDRIRAEVSALLQRLRRC